jgi:NAD(P)-dependent dehydrogenase (short-subunit alcohol dehydrogenase family)
MPRTQSSVKTLGGAVALGIGAGIWLRRRARTRAFDFRGRVVVITGGSRGLGLLLARALAARGAQLALIARDQDELQHAEAELAQQTRVLTVVCDVTDRHAIEHTIHEIAAYFGGIDVLINNAGMIKVGPLENMGPDDFEQSLRVHALAPLHATFAALPWLRRAGNARLVNISSVGGKVAVPHLAAYCAGKFALTGLSEALRVELRRYGILVTTVCPSTMRTGSLPHVRFTGQHEHEYAWFAAAASLPLLSMNAEHAAERIVRACARGQAELSLTPQARLATALQGLLPGLTSSLLSLVDRLLPGPVPRARTRTGRDSRPAHYPRWLTSLSDDATRANNENGQ